MVAPMARGMKTNERRVGGARIGALVAAETYARVARTLSKQLEQ
jgi:hypothetical protein